MRQGGSETKRYRWYVLGILALTYAFSFMDGQILSILLEDIRAQFSLSDLRLGLLSGIAFALSCVTLVLLAAAAMDWRTAQALRSSDG